MNTIKRAIHDHNMHNLDYAINHKLSGKLIATNGNKILVLREQKLSYAPDAKYMTISKMYTKEQGYSFYWGHYDLTLEQAFNDIGLEEQAA